MRQLKSRVIVATENAKFFYYLNKELVLDGFQVMHVTPGAVDLVKVPRDAIVITTGAEAPSIPASLFVLPFDDARYVLNEENVRNFHHMIRILMDAGIDECNSVEIGIDPGFKHTGLAVFINGTFVEASIVPTSDANIAQFINTAIAISVQNCTVNGVPPVKIKVGDGSPIETHKVITFLLRMQREYPFEIQVVNEFHSNSDDSIKERSFIKISDHARAAINIALRDGMRMEETQHAGWNGLENVSRKQVKRIQVESRLASGGDGIMIDQRLARKVLLGKMTLQEAIDCYRHAKENITRIEGNQGTA